MFYFFFSWRTNIVWVLLPVLQNIPSAHWNVLITSKAWSYLDVMAEDLP